MRDSRTVRPGGLAARIRGRRNLIILIGVFIALGLGAYFEIDSWLTRRELTMVNPDDIAGQPTLVRYAIALGQPAYAANCAGCHGADMKGNHAKGAPNLADAIWLYDQGRVSDIERTILYGIRSGLGKTRNVTDMPGLGRTKQLNAEEVRDVETYIFSLSSKKGEPGAIARGARLFQDKGNCYDCHGRDAEGVPDYGSPRLDDTDWLYGGDPDTVYRSIYDGRHGVCPAWIGKLSYATIRGLAVYVYEKSHPAAAKPTTNAGNPSSGANGAG